LPISDVTVAELHKRFEQMGNNWPQLT
jgi:hypothetical protein